MNLANSDRLSGLDVDLEGITQTLLEKGVASFAGAFEGLMRNIEEKRDRLQQGNV